MIINFDKVHERDIDLYVISNFCNCSPFLNLFLNKIGKKGYKVYSAESSLSDNDGESDITIVLEKKENKIGLLIEDKIDAKAMPNQCKRYTRRGNKGIKDKKYDEFYVFIIAPKDYLESNYEAQKYPYKISYEDILEVIEDEYGKALFSSALEKKRKGYEPIEDKNATKFWNDYYKFVDQFNEKNKCNIDIPRTNGPRGGKAGWPTIRTNTTKVVIMHKSDRGYLDLTFNGLGRYEKEFHQYMRSRIEEKMTIYRTGNSMAIRMIVPKIDFQGKMKDYKQEMNEIMCSIKYLLDYFYNKIDVYDVYDKVKG